MKTVGILGGGQLARMMALAGYPLGIRCVLYDPDSDACGHFVAPLVEGPYQGEHLQRFADSVDVLTYENENLPVDVLRTLSKSILPSIDCLEKAQDRWLEKELFRQLSIPTNTSCLVTSSADLPAIGEQLGYPFLLKTRREGYDGKGQIKIQGIHQARNFQLPPVPSGYVAEAWVPFNREVSLVGVRDAQGQMTFYDLNENIHHQGILVRTVNQPQDPKKSEAQEYLTRVLERFDYVGVLTIEFFELHGKLVANEMAPRVHNSGHWTIEGAVTSQFENHLRAILGLPLGGSESRGYCTLSNLIGEMPDAASVLHRKGFHWHDYQKTAKIGRKLGHVTAVFESLEARAHANL